MGQYTNADGLIQRSGPLLVEDQLPRTTEDSYVREIVADIFYSTASGSVNGLMLPTFDQDAGGGTTPDSFSGRQACIPAGATILSAVLVVNTTFAGGTNLAIGTYTKAGVAIDADGIFTTSNLTVAANKLDAGKVWSADGVDVIRTSGSFDGSCVDGSNEAYLYVTPTGTFTAGSARLIVQYIPKRG